MADTVTVVVFPWRAGKPRFFPLWTKVKIRTSLDEICHQIEVTMPPSEMPRVSIHDTIQVRLSNAVLTAGRPVSTGLIDSKALSVSAEKSQMIVKARSPARDIVDSTWSVTRLPTQQLSKAFNAICRINDRVPIQAILNDGGEFLRAYVLGFNRRPDPSDHVVGLSWENESPWQRMIQEADAQNYILTSDQLGILCIQRVSSVVRTEGFRVDEGNFISLEDEEAGTEQYRKYVFSGTCSGVKRTVELIDDTCRPGRILTVNVTDPGLTPAKLRTRAQTELSRRRTRRTTVKVKSWGLSEVQLRALGDLHWKEVFWLPNFLTPVNLPLAGIQDNLLTSAVEYEATTDSMTCALELARKEEYQ